MEWIWIQPAVWSRIVPLNPSGSKDTQPISILKTNTNVSQPVGRHLLHSIIVARNDEHFIPHFTNDKTFYSTFYKWGKQGSKACINWSVPHNWWALEKDFKPIFITWHLILWQLLSNFLWFCITYWISLKILNHGQRFLEHDLTFSVQNCYVGHFFTVGALWSDFMSQGPLNMLSAFKHLFLSFCHPFWWNTIPPTDLRSGKKRKKAISSRKTSDGLRKKNDHCHLWIIVSLTPVLWHIAILPRTTVPYGRLPGTEGLYLPSAHSIEVTSSKFSINMFQINDWWVIKNCEKIQKLYTNVNYYYLCFKF